MKNFKKENGVITLEACVVVPVFVILMLLMNGLFVMFMGQQLVGHAAMQTAKSLAFDPYAAQRNAANTEDQLADMIGDIFSNVNGGYVSTDPWYEGSAAREVEERFMLYFNASASDDMLDIAGISNLDFSGSTVSDGVLTVKITYTQSFVYAVSDLTTIPREITLQVKLFQYKGIS